MTVGEIPWTPGPWAWFGNTSTHYLSLATTHSGRRFVMSFARWGMRNAQPMFQQNGILEPASDLARFVVGNPDIQGANAAKKDRSVYRYNIREIDHPDAHLIATAPELAEMLEQLAEQNKCECGHPTCNRCEDYRQAWAVLDKAKGRNT